MRPSKWIYRSVSSIAISAGLTLPALAQDPDPDSVVVLDPILVRVLPSTIGTQAPYPVSVLTGSQLTRATASTFIEEPFGPCLVSRSTTDLTLQWENGLQFVDSVRAPSLESEE